MFLLYSLHYVGSLFICDHFSKNHFGANGKRKGYFGNFTRCISIYRILFTILAVVFIIWNFSVLSDIKRSELKLAETENEENNNQSQTEN